MKVCPSCNARVDDDADACPACEHSFNGSGSQRTSKQTIMGVPTAVGEDSEPEEDSHTGAGKTIGGIPAVGGGIDDGGGDDDDAKTAVADAPDLSDLLSKTKSRGDGGDKTTEKKSSSEGSESKFDRNKLKAALQKKKQKESGDDESGGDSGEEPRRPNRKPKQTMAGTPVGDQADVTAERDVADVVGDGGDGEDDDVPATAVLDPDELDLAADRDRAFGDGDDEPEEETKVAGDEVLEEYGTLTGMKIDELSNGGDGAGAMHQGKEGESEASTQALSPEQLAEIDEMELGDAGEAWDSGDLGGGSDRLKPGDKSGVPGLTDSLESPTAEPGETAEREVEPIADEKAAPKSEQEERGSRDTPLSGVLRASGKKLGEESSSEADDSRAGGSRLGDGRVGGTGTYSVSNTNTGAESAEEEDEDLALGGVGEGGKTRFPAGGGPEESSPEEIDEPAAAAEPVVDDEPDAPAGLVDGEEEPESIEEIERRVPNTGPVSSPQTGPADDSVAPPEMEPEDAGGEASSPVQKPAVVADSPEAASDEVEMKSKPTGMPADDGEPEAAPAPQATADAGLQPGPPESKPQPEALSPDPKEQPLDPSTAPDRTPETKEAPPAESPDPAPGKRETPAAPGPDAGFEADFGAEQVSGKQAEAPAQKSEPSADDQVLGGVDLERIISLMQRGFGLLGIVPMLVLVVGVVISDGVPAMGPEMGIFATPLVLAVLVLGVTLIPVGDRLRSISYVGIGLVAILGFMAGLVVEAGVLLAIGLFSSGLLLLVAAMIPLLGKAIEA